MTLPSFVIDELGPARAREPALAFFAKPGWRSEETTE
jgi:hypothetical protein